MLQQLPLKALRFRSPVMRALVWGEGTGGVKRNHHADSKQHVFPWQEHGSNRVAAYVAVPAHHILQDKKALPAVVFLQTRKASSSSSSSSGNGKAGDDNRTTAKEHKVVKKKAATSFIPRKAPVTMTESTRTFFKALLETKPDATGIVLNYHQSSSGEPRMVFSFDFLHGPAGPSDEPVSLEVLEDGVTPKSPADSIHDGLPKLYIHHNAFMKVLGCKVDVNTDTLQVTIYDRDGFVLDPNA